MLQLQLCLSCYTNPFQMHSTRLDLQRGCSGAHFPSLVCFTHPSDPLWFRIPLSAPTNDCAQLTCLEPSFLVYQSSPFPPLNASLKKYLSPSCSEPGLQISLLCSPRLFPEHNGEQINPPFWSFPREKTWRSNEINALNSSYKTLHWALFPLTWFLWLPFPLDCHFTWFYTLNLSS